MVNESLTGNALDNTGLITDTPVGKEYTTPVEVDPESLSGNPINQSNLPEDIDHEILEEKQMPACACGKVELLEPLIQFLDNKEDHFQTAVTTST